MKRDDSDALTKEAERLVDEAFRNVSWERHQNNFFPFPDGTVSQKEKSSWLAQCRPELRRRKL